MPGVGSCLVHIDDDRMPLDDGAALADGATLGEKSPEAERAGESPALGGYPALADRELPSPGGVLDGADAEGASVDDDGVLHTSRELESLDE